MFGGGETRPFEEVQYRNGCHGKLLTGTRGGLKVLAGKFGPARKYFFGVTSHHWEVEQPPGEAEHRNVQQLVLDKEFEHGDMPPQNPLQDQNVCPRLMVTEDEIPFVSVQSESNTGVDLDTAGKVKQEVIVVYPAFSEGVHQPGDPAAVLRPAAQPEQGRKVKDGAKDEGVERHQAESKQSSQGGKHGRLSMCAASVHRNLKVA